MNDPYRICFRWTGSDAEDVEIVDYLCRLFGLSDGWWPRLQADYATESARAALAKILARIRPWGQAANR